MSRTFLRTAPHCDKRIVIMAKNSAAVTLGRRGGKAYVKNSTAEERKESARKAARARWAKKKKEKA